MQPESVVFACDMGALSPEQRTHHLATTRALFGSVRGVRELSSGYEFEFRYSVDSLHGLADFVVLERLCCPFFSFSVHVAAGDSLSLHLSGPTGVKPFILAELGSAIPSHLRPRA